MNWLRELARRLRMLMHRRQFDTDLEEEMRLHLELRQQQQIESGMSPDDARAAARVHLGLAGEGEAGCILVPDFHHQVVRLTQLEVEGALADFHMGANPHLAPLLHG